MWGSFRRKTRNIFARKKHSFEIEPDEIFLDASNIPDFDTESFEGRIESPIEKKTLFSVVIAFVIIAVLFTGRLFFLQVKDGEAYADKSENNLLNKQVVFAERGLVEDRNGVPLVWNDPGVYASSTKEFPARSYIKDDGFGHILGYVSYPKKDSAGFYYQDYFEGKDGVEAIFNDELKGKNGIVLTETNAKGQIESESAMEMPISGERISLSIDSRLQDIFYKNIKAIANQVDFRGGTGLLMDVKTGELLVLTSFPEYHPEDLITGDSQKIKSLTTNQATPFLNRAVGGVYTPGSIIKPFLALGVLSENIIDPEKKILSTGKIEIQNPYNKEEKTVFPDWKAHGWVDMRKAIAVSSNVYFYEVGGGFEGQKGLGIYGIDKYMKMFGFGNLTGVEFQNEEAGTIPSPEWKEENFPGDPWRIGDTYHTAIGQYGFQVTPLQMVRGYAAIANSGKLFKPLLKKVSGEDDKDISFEQLPISPSYFEVVREGMRLGAEIGTAVALNTPAVKIAAKTGTAQVGLSKQFVNSWAVGFFPYDNPRYAFTVLMEHGPVANLVGAAVVTRRAIDQMAIETPEYFK